MDRQTYWIEYESLANGDGVGGKEDETWSFHFEIDALKSDYLDRKERNKEKNAQRNRCNFHPKGLVGEICIHFNYND